MEAGLKDIRESFTNWLGARQNMIAGFQQGPESTRWREPMAKLSRQGLACTETRAGNRCDEHVGDQEGNPEVGAAVRINRPMVMLPVLEGLQKGLEEQPAAHTVHT